MTPTRRRRIKSVEREPRARRRAEPTRAPSKLPGDRVDWSGGVGHKLPAHTTARPLRRAGILRMQRHYGNAAVQRYLSSLDPAGGDRVVQRQIEPEKVKGEAALGTKEAKLKADLNLSSDGSLKLNVGPALDLKLFGLSTVAAVDPKGWEGIGKLRLGSKAHYLAPKVTVGSDGKLAFEFEHKFARDMLTLSSKLSSGEKGTSLSHTVGLKDVFGVGGFDVKAAVKYRVDDPRFTSAKVSGEYTLLKGGKGSPKLMLILQGSYQAGGANKAEEAKGFVLLRLGG